MKSKYRTAEQSRKPGYLAKRFAVIRREQAATARASQDASAATQAAIDERDRTNELERISKVRTLPVSR